MVLFALFKNVNCFDVASLTIYFRKRTGGFHPPKRTLDFEKSTRNTQNKTNRLKMQGVLDMAKRFTDTDKWRKQWFRELGSRLRDLRQFILDNCDHAGIIEMDVSTFQHFTGHRVSVDDIDAAFRGKITVDDGKIFVHDFIEFQYGCTFPQLNPQNKVHASVLDRHKKYKFIQSLNAPRVAPRVAPMHGAKDKDKEKDKDKYIKNRKFDFENHYQLYPRKAGKTKGLTICQREIKTEQDFENLRKAILNYKQICETNKTEKQFIKHFSTFMGSWRDYLDADVDSTNVKTGTDWDFVFTGKR